VPKKMSLLPSPAGCTKRVPIMDRNLLEMVHRDHAVWLVADHFQDHIQTAAKEALSPWKVVPTQSGPAEVRRTCVIPLGCPLVSGSPRPAAWGHIVEGCYEAPIREFGSISRYPS
jgi:hypothetical protein